MPTVSCPDPDMMFAVRGWLSEHPPAFRALMLSEAVMLDVPSDQPVFWQGEEATGVYGIMSGAIGVEGGHARQTPMLGHILRAGEWFGMKALLFGGPRLFTYRAIEPSRLLFVPRSRLAPLIERDPVVAVRAGQLAEIGNRLGAWIARDLLTRDAGRRLAAVLYRVMGAGEVEPDDPQGFWMTHRQLAEMANLSRHHVGRKLALFEAAGWIACGYNRIRLLDGVGLSAFAYGDED